MAGILTPLQLIAGAGLLQNQGLVISPELSAAIDAYLATPLITAYKDAVTAGADILNISANSVPAFTDSYPSSATVVMSDAILAQATVDFGSGDLSKFIQALNLVLAYSETSNIFINSAVNSQTYLGNTFTSTNDSITGDLTAVNLATGPFGTDLANLGVLINFATLDDWGSPLTLVQRLVEISGNIPVVSVAFLLVGVPQEVVIGLTNPTLSVTDSVQKLMYLAMTQITGEALTQILAILRVTTVGINTMADLLNPVKLFPNSFQSLTAPTANGPRAIYINSTGTVNSSLVEELPPYVINTIV